MKIIAKTLQGLENVLASELEEIGAKSIKPLKRAVSYEGNKKIIYKSNYLLRTALKILEPVYNFKANNEKELYESVYHFDWPFYFNENRTFAIRSTIFSEKFKHSGYTSLKVKDAIVDRFRKDTGKRPNVDSKFPEISINVHCTNNLFTISFDSSGESLHKRGYKSNKHRAPLNEVLAAGMVLLSGWDKKETFTDFMCGSGTIVTEAAMIAANIPPGFKRKYFAFMKQNSFDNNLWNKITNEANKNINKTNTNFLINDISDKSIETTSQNLKSLDILDNTKIHNTDFKNEKISSEQGTIIINPPYGERMEKEDINAFYKSIGDKLKKDFTGSTAWILSANRQALKQVGLRPSKKLTLFNGSLECGFYKYDLYKGSKKQ